MKTLIEQIQSYRNILIETVEDHSMEAGIRNGIKNAQKLGNATMLYYYLYCSKKDLKAVVPYEGYINSWAGGLWFDRNIPKIKEVLEQENKNSWRTHRKWFVDEPKTN